MSFEDLIAKIDEQRGMAPEVLPEKYWPLMATFDDLSRPETLHIITGTDLSPWFGPGAAVQNITLQITRERVTKGRIEAFLPWFMPDSYQRAPVAPAPAPPLRFSAFLSIDHWNKK